MDMTKLGKSLVLANLVLSLVFVAWAIGLVSNAVPWTAPQGSGVQGMVEELKREIDRLVPAQQAADARWASAYTELLAVEKQRPDNQRYYADMLRSARQGGVAAVNPPVQALRFQNNMLVMERRGGPPLTLNDKPALPQAGYAKASDDALKAIQQAQAEEKQITADTEKLTTQINGTKPRDQAVNAAEKGLRVLLAEQEEMIKALHLEGQYLYSPLTYTTLQTAQLRQRQAQLAARLDELNRGGPAAGRRSR